MRLSRVNLSLSGVREPRQRQPANLRGADEFTMLVVQDILYCEVQAQSRGRSAEIEACADIPNHITFDIANIGTRTNWKTVGISDSRVERETFWYIVIEPAF